MKDKISQFLNATNLQSLPQNLNEFKNLIFKMLLAWSLGLIVVYIFQSSVYNLYVAPLKENNLILNFLSPTDSMAFYIKIFTISALIISLPIQAVLFWNYIKDGLKQVEQRTVKNYFWVGSIMSIGAIIYGWMFLIPSVFKFLIGINPPQSQLLLSSKEYSNFVFGMLLMLILTFQIPLIVYSLIQSKLLTKKQITDKRREIYVGILIITALFGSPDVITWLLSSIPVALLFEISTILAHHNLKKS